MLFCPVCSNLLLVERGRAGEGLRFSCPTCPYVHPVRTRIERAVQRLPRKQVDDVLGGEAAWRLAEQTTAACPRCAHPKAYFFQMQTRSADEPMSVFYRCVECAHQWKEN